MIKYELILHSFMWYLVKKYRLFRVKRKLAVYGAFFLSMWFGYIYSGLAKNLYTLGYYQGIWQPFDFSLHLMNSYGADDKFKYNIQLTTLMKQGFESHGESFDVLDWLMLGQHFARTQEDEIAFQSYYMAHLMDHERIRTNSQLKFETNSFGSGPG
jgi:hypothetical protein